MSLSATAVLLDASPVFPPVSAGLLGSSDGSPAEAYVVVVANHVGTVLKVLALAFPGDITETLNAPTEFDITFPRHAYTTDDVDLIGNVDTPLEIQVFIGATIVDDTHISGGQILAWGPAVADSGGGSATGPVTLHCYGVDWYFAKRAVDMEPENILVDGNFPSLTHWNDSGTASGGPGGGTIGDNTTATVVADVFEVGKNAVQLAAAFAPTGLALASDPVTFTAGAHGNDVLLTFSLQVESFVAPALFNAGVLFIGSPPGHDGSVIGGVNAKGAARFDIDHTTPRQTKIRGSCKVHVEAKKTWALQVWLFCPTGVVDFGELAITPLRSLSTADFTGSPTAPAVDVARIVRMLDDWCLTANHSNGKSDLNIGVDAPACGVRMARKYEFADHVQHDQALAELNERHDCFDQSIVLTRTSRVHTLWPISIGGQGVDRSADVTLTYGAAPVNGYVPNIDGGSTATQVAMLGEGDGPAREEAWSTDTSQLHGVVLQSIISAPAGAPRESLGPLADAAVARARRPARIIQVTIDRRPGGYGPDATVILMDLLGLGDIITAAIANGWYTFDGLWRIVQRIRHCTPRTMTYTLNEVIA